LARALDAMSYPELDLDLNYRPRLPGGDHRIGIVGGGWIVRECHLPAYSKAGFHVAAIASRAAGSARALAARFRLPRVYDDWHELVADTSIEILDVAFPPDRQHEVIACAVQENPGLKGILAQKPLAHDLATARKIVAICEEAEVALAVNQNMRYDQSIRALNVLLERGYLGRPVSAQITMHARVTWMPYAATYERLALLIMSVHHLDAFRFLFGEPERIVASVRPDHELDRPHVDGMAVYVLEYSDGFRAVSIDNCLTRLDQGIEWRVEGTEGVAKGTIGWPDYPHGGSPSTLDFATDRRPGYWFCPRWEERWFPDAFIGTMAQLLRAVEDGNEPEIGGRDNLRTMALVEAAYRAAATGLAVRPDDVLVPDSREVSA
jgi:predicted dehydrogenase